MCLCVCVANTAMLVWFNNCAATIVTRWQKTTASFILYSMLNAEHAFPFPFHCTAVLWHFIYSVCILTRVVFLTELSQPCEQTVYCIHLLNINAGFLVHLSLF